MRKKGLATQLMDQWLCAWFQAHCFLCRCSLLAPDSFCIPCKVGLLESSDPIRVEGASPIERVFSQFQLSDSARKVLHGVKFEKRLELLETYRFRLKPDAWPEDCELVPVPMYWKKWIDRGFNQTESLARWLSKESGRSLRLKSLVKCRPTRAQSHLNKKERRKNLNGAFQWLGKSVPKSVVLVDDVYTTGATVHECAAVLNDIGIKRIFVWTLFRA